MSKAKSKLFRLRVKEVHSRTYLVEASDEKDALQRRPWREGGDCEQELGDSTEHLYNLDSETWDVEEVPEKPPTEMIVFLNDGETYSPVSGCKLVELTVEGCNALDCEGLKLEDIRDEHPEWIVNENVVDGVPW